MSNWMMDAIRLELHNKGSASPVNSAHVPPWALFLREYSGQLAASSFCHVNRELELLVYLNVMLTESQTLFLSDGLHNNADSLSKVNDMQTHSQNNQLIQLYLKSTVFFSKIK